MERLTEKLTFTNHYKLVNDDMSKMSFTDSKLGQEYRKAIDKLGALEDILQHYDIISAQDLESFIQNQTAEIKKWKMLAENRLTDIQSYRQTIEKDKEIFRSIMFSAFAGGIVSMFEISKNKSNETLNKKTKE